MFRVDQVIINSNGKIQKNDDQELKEEKFENKYLDRNFNLTFSSIKFVQKQVQKIMKLKMKISIY